jgi:hypothetical protein
LEERLAALLDYAETAEVQIGREQLDKIGAALRKTKNFDDAEEFIDSLKESLETHLRDRDLFGEAERVGGGSRPGDIAAELPEGTSPLGRVIQNPKEVANFLKDYTKVRDTPESVVALDKLFTHTKSGSLSNSPRPGKYLPKRTRAAAAEFESIIELSSRPEVESIELIPESSTVIAGLETEGRTVDKVVTLRKGDQLIRQRYEDTTVVGAGSKYRLRGYAKKAKGGSRIINTARVRDIRSAIIRKVRSTPDHPSQFDAFMGDVPKGGTLAVHIPYPGRGGPAKVARAITNLPELINSSVDAVEFYLPAPNPSAPEGQIPSSGQPVRRQVIRYERKGSAFVPVSSVEIAP